MIDTNVLLDDILDRAPNAEASRKIIHLIAEGEINACVTTNCLTDIFYVVSKKQNQAIARQVIRELLLSFFVIDVTAEDCWQAISSLMNDFEDALVVACAAKASLNYIITNDKDFLSCANLAIQTISPIDFLSKMV